MVCRLPGLAFFLWDPLEEEARMTHLNALEHRFCGLVTLIRDHTNSYCPIYGGAAAFRMSCTPFRNTNSPKTVSKMENEIREN
mmetsp:Transcript_4027/g.9176  ORF Transcript_4027/g.9176 Transcript_4027/m.9176 type:complete len:83 (+) Transcript_4027:512-760(+)